MEGKGRGVQQFHVSGLRCPPCPHVVRRPFVALTSSISTTQAPSRGRYGVSVSWWVTAVCPEEPVSHEGLSSARAWPHVPPCKRIRQCYGASCPTCVVVPALRLGSCHSHIQ